MDTILDGAGNILGYVDGISVLDAARHLAGSTGVNAAGNRTGRVPNTLVLDRFNRIAGRFERNRVFDVENRPVGRVESEHVFDVAGHLVARVPLRNASDRIHAGAAALLLLGKRNRQTLPDAPADDA